MTLKNTPQTTDSSNFMSVCVVPEFNFLHSESATTSDRNHNPLVGTDIIYSIWLAISEKECYL